MSIRIIAAAVACMFLIHVFLKRKDSHDRIYALNYMYLVLLFSLYPLVFSPIQGYQNMGAFKARIWAVITIALIVYEVVYAVALRIMRQDAVKNSFAGVISQIKNSPPDIAMIAYVLLATVSFAMAKDKVTALSGAYGWFTGLLFQYAIVAVYFSVSRFGRPDKKLINIILVSAMIVFAIGILHRFTVDPIGIYRLLQEEEYIRFLSTIGQATWYSSYLCLVFPLGLHIFLFTKEDSEKKLSGAFLVISAMTLVTQNSDTAYGAFFVIIVCYLILAFLRGEACTGVLKSLGMAVLLMSVGIIFMGLLERLFADRLVSIDELSIRIAQGIVPLAGIAAGIIMMLLDEAKAAVKRGAVAGMGLAICAAGVMLIFRYAADAYLILGKDWGNGRGLIWMRTIQMFRDQPLINKIFGIGPGMFYEKVSDYTELILANAHNEWLTAVVELGIAGGLVYLGIFVLAIAEACKSIISGRTDAEENEFGLNHYDFVIIAMTLGYIVHGFFNYQQCISTPMYFALLALGRYYRFDAKMSN